MSELKEQIEELCRKAKEASRQLAIAPTDRKNEMLRSIAEALDQGRDRILEANQKDLKRGAEEGLSSAMLDRLELNEKRIKRLMKSLPCRIRLKRL